MACLYSSIMTQETHQDYQPLMTSVDKEVTPLTEENLSVCDSKEEG